MTNPFGGEDPKNYCAIYWHIDDVVNVRPDLDKHQAREVLSYISNHHDAEYGVCWETLRIAADILFPQRGET